MIFLIKRNSEIFSQGLFGKIFDPLDAFDAPDIGYLHYQVVEVFSVMDVDIHRAFKYPVLNSYIDFRHVYLKLRRDDIRDLIYQADPVDAGHIYSCKK